MNQAHITHPFTLEAAKFKNYWILAKDDPMYIINDAALITNTGTREQRMAYIVNKHTDKLTKGYCYLELSDTRGVDDVSPSLNGQPDQD